MPKISIILSAYNAADTLPQALQSLKDQTLSDWECIAINDGSTDQTKAILQAAAAQDSRFRLVQHVSSQGLTASLIEASGLATGDYLARQDADDWSEPSRLSLQMALLERFPNCAGVGSSSAIHLSNGEFLDTVEAPTRPSALRRMLRRRNPLAHGSLVIRRSAFDRAGGYRPVFRYAQDYDLLLRLLEIGPLRACRDALYHHRLSSSGIGRARRVQQAAYADLARTSAKLRESGKPDNRLLKGFIEPAADTPDSGIDAILIHLVKSGRKQEAQVRLAQWNPADYRGKFTKRVLSGLNTVPLPVRHFLLQIHRFWQMR